MIPEAKTVLLSTAYLAPVEYYLQMITHPQVIIEQHCNYVRQTCRNRCIIASVNGLQMLSIPIVKPDSPKCPTKDVRIVEHGNWRRLHWNAMVSAYNSTPFFEYYEDDFRPFYEKPQTFLFDFNETLRELICSLLDISPKVGYSDTYITEITQHTLDLREAIHPKKEPTVVHFQPYYQVYADKFGFQANLSIIDMLFNMGPESAIRIKQQT